MQTDQELNTKIRQTKPNIRKTPLTDFSIRNTLLSLKAMEETTKEEGENLITKS